MTEFAKKNDYPLRFNFLDRSAYFLSCCFLSIHFSYDMLWLLKSLSYDLMTKVFSFLLQKPFNFLENYKNPCWYEETITGTQTLQNLRCLPYFHIFGVCKSGTTDLYRRLLKHPQVVPNKGMIQKETSYWTWFRYGKSKNFSDVMKNVRKSSPKFIFSCEV